MEILAKSVGRRKEAVAQVQLLRGTGQFQINEKSAEIYLQNNTFSLLKINSPFEALAFNFSTQTINRTSGPGIQKNPDSSIEQELKTSIVKTLQSSKGLLDFIDIIVKVKGGGLIGQAEAIKLAVARALCKIDHFSISEETSFEKNEPSIEISSNQTLSLQDKAEAKFGGKSPIVAPLTGTAQSSKEDLDLVNKKEIRKILKLKGYLTQDARVKERRKYGLKKARKAPQYSKR